MVNTSLIGRVVLGLAVVAFGVIGVIAGGWLPELQHPPAGAPAALGYASSALLIAGGGLLITDRVRVASRLLLALIAIWVLAFYAPVLIAHPRAGGVWTGMFEVIAMASGLAVLIGAALPARIAFGVSLLVFGLMHVIYSDYVASVIPGWIPGHTFWAYATGAFHVAGGLALLAGICARPAAILLTAMFGSWVVLLHVPRAVAAGAVRAEWTSTVVALAMVGTSLLFVDRAPSHR